MTRKRGSFAFGGPQRSYSFPFLHADMIPNSTTAVRCPNVECEQVLLQNDPDSTDNIIIGSERLSIIGRGIVLEPGNFSGWIPVENLNLIWHEDADATSTLNYMVVR